VHLRMLWGWQIQANRFAHLPCGEGLGGDNAGRLPALICLQFLNDADHIGAVQIIGGFCSGIEFIALDTATSKMNSMLDHNLSLSEVGQEHITRQACHALIATVSKKILAKSYWDSSRYKRKLADGGWKDVMKGSGTFGRFLRAQDSAEFRNELIASMAAETLTEYVESQWYIVHALSSGSIDFQNYKSVQGAKFLDAVTVPVILDKMQDRYRRFRGYKESAKNSHIAHYRCLINASVYMHIDKDYEGNTNLHLATREEKERYWFECTTRAVLLVLVQLELGFSFNQLREFILNGSSHGVRHLASVG